jgi:F-type H+-transporting ATPase subunit b
MESGHQTRTVETIQHVTGSSHQDPSAFGLTGSGWVALAVIAAIGPLIWKKTPSILASLDSKIAAISGHLDEAAALRTSAEAVRDEFAAKLKFAEHEREEMLLQAERLADEICAKAKADAQVLTEGRRQRANAMIAHSERQAVEHLRASAADAAANATNRILLEKCDAATDARLFEEAIQQIRVSGNS